MLIFHTLYAFMYKRKMKLYKNDLEFQWGNKVSKIYLGLHMVKIDIHIFIQGINSYIHVASILNRC